MGSVMMSCRPFNEHRFDSSVGHGQLFANLVELPLAEMFGEVNHHTAESVIGLIGLNEHLFLGQCLPC